MNKYSRFWVSTLIGVGMLASCSKSVPVKQSNGNNATISFTPLLLKSGLRAGAAPAAPAANVAANVLTTANLDKFWVSAYKKDDVATKDMEYMKVEKETTAGSNGSPATVNWKNEKEVLWPEYTLAFKALAPEAFKTKAEAANTFAFGKDPVELTVDKDVAKHQDYIVAYKESGKLDNQCLALNFKHIFSQIEVKAKNSSADKYEVEVVGVKFVGTDLTAKFAFPTAETKTNDNVIADKWSEVADKTEKIKNAVYAQTKDKITAKVTLTNTATRIMGDNNFMMIPQEKNEWTGKEEMDGAYIGVKCRIYKKEDNSNRLIFPKVTDTKDLASLNGKYGYACVAVPCKWDPGKKYVYTLEFSQTGMGAIDPGKNDNDKDPDKDNIDKPDQKGGTPILNGPICFTVTVDGWTEGSVTNIPMGPVTGSSSGSRP